MSGMNFCMLSGPQKAHQTYVPFSRNLNIFIWGCCSHRRRLGQQMQKFILAPLLQWASQQAACTELSPLQMTGSERFGMHSWSPGLNLASDADSIANAAATLQKLLDMLQHLQQEQPKQIQLLQDKLQRNVDEREEDLAAKVSNAVLMVLGLDGTP